MFVNQLHQGGIRALIDWDNTIFDNMALPEDVELTDVVDHILYKYGDTPLFTPDPAVVKFYIGRWSTRRLPVWNKYKELLEIDFNPLENYNRTEHTDNTLEVTKNNTGTQRFEKTGTDTTTNSGTDSTSHSGTDTTTHSGDDTNVKTGNIRTTNDDITTTFDSAYNTSAWSNDKKEEFDGDKTETYNSVQDKLTYGESVDFTHGESVDLTHGHIQSIGYNTTDERTDNLVEFNDHSGSVDTNIHGNIGVMSSQDMFKQQLEIIPYYDLIDFIATDWHQEFNLYIY